jgi:hypothetical protein
MKSTIAQIESRIELKNDNSQGIIKYDVDNAYPQRVRLLVEGSGTASACVKLFGKYIRGLGFQEPTFYSSICNTKRWTFDRLLKSVSDDYAMFGGFAIHVNYNSLLEISEMNYVPFEFVRLCIPDDTGYVSKVKVYNDWGKKLGSRIDENKMHEINIFNPDPEVVLKQIEAAEGIDKYKGQVMYFTNDADTYPLAPVDSIYEDVQTDGELKHYNNRNVTTGFMPQVIWSTKGKFEDKKDLEEHLENIKAFQGVRNGAKVIHLEIESDEEVPNIQQIKNEINDKLFEHTEQSVRENIIRCFMIPNILLGVSTPNALGEKNDREGAKNVYSDITKDERIVMEAVFAVMFERWHKQEDNPTKNFSIQPIQGVPQTINAELYKDMTLNERRQMLLNLPAQQEQQAATKLLVETLGVGGTQALQTILVDQFLTPQQKRATLRLVFGFTEDEALQLIPETNG